MWLHNGQKAVVMTTVTVTTMTCSAIRPMAHYRVHTVNTDK